MTDASDPTQKDSDMCNNSTNQNRTVKFAFKLKKNEKVDIAKYHRDLLLAIHKIDSKAIFKDNKNNTFTPDIAKDYISRFDYQTFQRKHIQVCCVAHDIVTHVSVSNLKNELRNVLIKCRATLTANPWASLDVRDVGWFLGLHPRFHNRIDLTNRLQSLLKEVSEKPVPQFQLYSKTVLSGKPTNPNRISTHAIYIECESTHLFELRERLHKLYSTTNNKNIPGKFVPINFPHLQNLSAYTTIIEQQKNYLDNHRNIQLSGITTDDFHLETKDKDQNIPIREFLENSPLITWISPLSFDNNQLKWNISTTSSKYIEACQMIRNHVLNIIPSSTATIPNVMDSSIITSPAISTTTKNYLAALTNTIPSSPNSQYSTYTPNHSHTVSTTNVSSITTPTIHPQSSIQLENLKEHVSRSLKIIRSKFKTIQEDLRKELQNHATSISGSNQTNQNTLQRNVSLELSESIKSVKRDFEEFRHEIQNELKTQLATTVANAIKMTMSQLTTMITTEVNNALQTKLNALSPRNRKPKRSRAPNLDDSDDPIYRKLFDDVPPHACNKDKNNTQPEELHDPYEAANSLFEANMTLRPKSPPTYSSDMEEDDSNQP